MEQWRRLASLGWSHSRDSENTMLKSNVTLVLLWSCTEFIDCIQTELSPHDTVVSVDWPDYQNAVVSSAIRGVYRQVYSNFYEYSSIREYDTSFAMKVPFIASYFFNSTEATINKKCMNGFSFLNLAFQFAYYHRRYIHINVNPRPGRSVLKSDVLFVKNGWKVNFYLN